MNRRNRPVGEFRQHARNVDALDNALCALTKRVQGGGGPAVWAGSVNATAQRVAERAKAKRAAREKRKRAAKARKRSRG